ncbi:MAG: hypothetical protein H7Y60_13895 [Rhodospirillaceae bacterium]|nr:hypothetical protein [Rhodospirillales bacterium]
MSVSSVAPTPFYVDPDRLQIGLPTPRPGEGDGAAAESRLSMFAEEDEPSFWDVLDIINPLQHIPVVNDIYRDMSGDKIGVGARLLGGTLFGGAIGLAAAAANAMVEETTGKNVGGHVLALFKDDAAPAAPGATLLAQAAPSPATTEPAKAVAAEPAKIAAAAAENAAPVIDLPGFGAAATGQPMMFTADGTQLASVPVTATPITTTPVAATPAAAPLAAAQGAPKPLSGPARYLPTPSRTNVTPAALPAVTVPVASGSSRSNTPITGRAPNAAIMPNASANAATSAAMQRALAGQEAGHPMAPPTDGGNQTAANPDWFSAAWGQALDKYQRANQLNGKPPATVSVE